MEQSTCKVDNQGRITLPANWRKAQKVEAGCELVVSSDGPDLRVQTLEQSLDEAQRIVARHLRKSRQPAVEQLRRWRRREALLEEQEAAAHVKTPR